MSVELEERDAAAEPLPYAPPATVPGPAAEVENEYLTYRAVSTLAVASTAIGGLSLLALLDWGLLLIPVAGMLLAGRALWGIRRNPEELTGERFAKVGLGLSALFFAAGLGLHSFIYATEVPEGYQRVAYSVLNSESDDPRQIIPPAAVELNGKKIFIKGYIYPGAVNSGIKTFILVRDNGVCCFGAEKPKLHDMIQVNLQGGLAIDYHTRMHKLAGVFRIAPQIGKGSEVGQVLYQLDAEYVR